MSTVERQKMQLRNNSRTTCIAEPKQSLHEENMFTIMILSSQKWGLGKTGGPGPSLEPCLPPTSSSKYKVYYLPNDNKSSRQSAYLRRRQNNPNTMIRRFGLTRNTDPNYDTDHSQKLDLHLASLPQQLSARENLIEIRSQPSDLSLPHITARSTRSKNLCILSETMMSMIAQPRPTCYARCSQQTTRKEMSQPNRFLSRIQNTDIKQCLFPSASLVLTADATVTFRLGLQLRPVSQRATVLRGL